MFTGLVQEIGAIEVVERREGITRVRIAAPALARQLRTGDSVAVSGVCLTALEIADDHFGADLAQETVARTSLSRLRPGSFVNLELPTPAGTPLGGHIVQGHVDGVGRITGIVPVSGNGTAQTDRLLTVAVPATVARYIVEKGSIGIEGISLTVAAVKPLHDGEAEITIAIIPHTWSATNLKSLTPGSEVNLEADVLAKYAEQQAALRPRRTSTITEECLVAAGF